MTFSMTVWRRRAPMFSRRSLMRRVVGQGLDGLLGELDLDPLGGQERRVLADEGVLGLREDAHEVLAGQGVSSTRIGKRPWSSGMRSLGLVMWKAPAAMKRMWSVRTRP